MSATDELRRLLDERGIEWSSPELSPCQTRLPYVKFEPWCEGTLKVTMFNLTPEQAIAATLGDEDYERKMDALLCRLTNGKFSKSRAYDLDFMESCVNEEFEMLYADELNSRAERTPGTCHMSIIDEYELVSGDESYLCECSECGSQTWEPAHDLPLYCRKCGKAVKR